jgi:putative hydrolase of the HAD superfamily
MIKAVFFDLYFTLVGYEPSQEEVEAGLLGKLGISVSPEALRRPFSVANEIIYQELIPRPASRRSKEEMMALYARFHRNILKEAGIAAGEDVIDALLHGMLEVKMKLVLYDDVLPALDALKKRGLTVGLISNIERSMSGVLDELGLTPRLDVVVTSAKAGANKPGPEIFRYALRQAGVLPSEAVYVGDQYKVDVLGARGAGMQGILLDRGGHHADVTDCPRIKTLAEIVAYL